MDPNVALRDLLECIAANDREAAEESLEHLMDWLAVGGFPPGSINAALAAIRPES